MSRILTWRAGGSREEWTSILRDTAEAAISGGHPVLTYEGYADATVLAGRRPPPRVITGRRFGLLNGPGCAGRAAAAGRPLAGTAGVRCRSVSFGLPPPLVSGRIDRIAIAACLARLVKGAKYAQRKAVFHVRREVGA